MKAFPKISLAILAIVFAFQLAHAQQALDYKGHKIDAAGKVTDQDGKHIGNVTKGGLISDAAGAKVAYVDGKGSLIDASSGKNLGKVGKDGNFVPYASINTWTVSPANNGICLVKDMEGNVKAEVHETYKHIGACTVHCLSNDMTHGEVLGAEEMQAASYACTMHPDITSDKPGKCSKCGAGLTKKTE